MKEIERLKE